jgi:fructose-1,6-bisphosphatase/sedoheptulose 1,7-bisphosphatase-like protein
MLKGVNAMNGSIETQSLVMNSATGMVAKIDIRRPRG